MAAGILCKDQVIKLIQPDVGTVMLYKPSGSIVDSSTIGLSSIDLPLGDLYWEMKGSCRTGNKYKVTDLIQKHSLNLNGPHHLDEQPVTLKKQKVYLFKADLDIDLRGTNIQGKATGRSSVGRLDVLVRLLVDESDTFDYVDKDKQHELYIEVTPISFDLEVKKGTVLSQLRLFKGKENDISLTLDELYYEEDDSFPVLNENGMPLREPCQVQHDNIWFPFRLSLDSDPIAACSAYGVRKGLNNLQPVDPDRKNFYDPKKYWEQINSEAGTILLEPDRLYILRSKERLRIPAHLALECKSYTTQMGEWRIEYAGFAHPFFGSLRDDHRGTPLIFEVRGHNVPTILTDGIPLGNVRFLRMSLPAEEPKENKYEKQELTLSKCFSEWNNNP